MLNREETKVLNTLTTDAKELQKKCVSVEADQIIAGIDALRFSISALIAASARINNEERRVLREADQTFYLSGQDLQKFTDPTAAAQRIENGVQLLSIVAAGDVKAKK